MPRRAPAVRFRCTFGITKPLSGQDPMTEVYPPMGRSVEVDQALGSAQRARWGRGAWICSSRRPLHPLQCSAMAANPAKTQPFSIRLGAQADLLVADEVRR